MRIRFPLTALLLVACTAAGVPAMAGGITGEAIFDKDPDPALKSPYVVKVEKALADGDAAAERVLQQARVQCLQAQVKTRRRAAGLLAGEARQAKLKNDKPGLQAIAQEEKRIATQLEALKEQLKSEGGEEALEEAMKAEVEAPPKTSPPKTHKPEVAVAPATAPPEAPAFAIAASEIPKLMLGKWKRVEDGKLWGYYILNSSGLVRSFTTLKANGARNSTTGTWKVWENGDISFVNDDDGGNDMLRINLLGEDKAAGCHHLRKSDAEPYKIGPKVVEFTRDK